MTKKILVKYSAENADTPILSKVIRSTDATINIIHSDIGLNGGELLISIDGPEKKVEEVISLFEKHGVEVSEVKRTIKLDEELCLQCGACISLCPTGALHTLSDYSIALDEDKCTYCKACVPACPVRALKVVRE